MLRTLLCSLAIFLTGSVARSEDVTLGKLASKAPTSWESQKPSNKFRAYQFSVPKAKGDDADAELVIFFFGEGGGGGVAENLKRWKGQFEAPEGKTIDDIAKVETIKQDKAKLTYLDITGFFLSKFPPFDPNGKVTRKANHRRLAVVFECEDGPYFITLTGPAATVSAAKKDFDGWVKNFK